MASHAAAVCSSQGRPHRLKILRPFRGGSTREGCLQLPKECNSRFLGASTACKRPIMRHDKRGSPKSPYQELESTSSSSGARLASSDLFGMGPIQAPTSQDFFSCPQRDMIGPAQESMLIYIVPNLRWNLMGNMMRLGSGYQIWQWSFSVPARRGPPFFSLGLGSVFICQLIPACMCSGSRLCSALVINSLAFSLLHLQQKKFLSDRQGCVSIFRIFSSRHTAASPFPHAGHRRATTKKLVLIWYKVSPSLRFCDGKVWIHHPTSPLETVGVQSRQSACPHG